MITGVHVHLGWRSFSSIRDVRWRWQRALVGLVPKCSKCLGTLGAFLEARWEPSWGCAGAISKASLGHRMFCSASPSLKPARGALRCPK
eukprot:4974117-Pyramimonas_sp.AAC.1